VQLTEDEILAELKSHFGKWSWICVYEPRMRKAAHAIAQAAEQDRLEALAEWEDSGRDTENELITQVVALEAKLAMVAGALSKVEYLPIYEETDLYSGKYESVEECPICFGRRKFGGHGPGCPIAQALSAAQQWRK
jgi:hypothetical protein